MTTDTMTTTADPEIERKKALIAEGAARNPPVKLDMRYAVKRMEDALAESPAKSAEPPPPVQTSDRRDEDVAGVRARLEAVERELQEAKAALAAKAASAAEAQAEPRSGPKGMLTTMNMGYPGQLAKDEEDRKKLMEKATQAGIAHLISPRANNDAIREFIGRHMAENAQKLATEEGLARLKAKGPPVELVTMRVLPLGDGKISKGIHIPGFGDEYYSLGDIISDVPLATAKAHQANGMGEILRA